MVGSSRRGWLLGVLSVTAVGALTVAGCATPSIREPIAAQAAHFRAQRSLGALAKVQRSGRGARVEAGPAAGLLKVEPRWLDPAAAVGAVPSVEDLLPAADRPVAKNGLCPPDMVSIDDRFCIDRFEAAVVEILPNGDERPLSRSENVEGHVLRAVNEAGLFPQGYISGVQAAQACARSGKRLCKPQEWRKACKGPEGNKFGYGNQREPGRCNDHGKSPMIRAFGVSGDRGDAARWTAARMNDPQLNQLPDTVAASGSHEGCTNGYGVYDMVGNLHEWVDDPEGTFQGGYYLDTHILGDGCDYRTEGHAVWYHDYSTGFRCCADIAP
jgi:hypothetical protein